MSESDGEQAARSLALEQAYVHEVYEQCADRTVQGRHWPRIYQFLEELEPGALVCDIGCGNGKYLNVNQNVFKIGADRCQRFANIAREKENEVLACDNLSLPFRDESFDAVLSIAVVHHFSTTERRVRALKELARVLRIGGRLIISVWAMEQKHRKFESQDVLVPWPKAYCLNSSGSPMKPRGMSYDERQHRGKSAQTYLLSKRSSQRNGNKSYWIDPIFSPSPSTSSLSSPNETCYSFFRRALQKLAGGRRSSRAWFLENWQANGGKRPHYDDEDDDGDVDDLPIELRRLEDPASLNLACASGSSCNGGSATASDKRCQLRQQHSDSLSVKSKSLGSIVEVQRLDLVRSRSSIPGLCGPELTVAELTAESQEHERLQQKERLSPASSKPRLVKQKTHFLEDACCPETLGPENTAIQPTTLKDIPELQQVEPSVQEQEEEEEEEEDQPAESEQLQPVSESNLEVPGALRRGNVHKQSSMNEEFMSIERLKERESVRRNIMKQASLNEELIYKSRPAFEAFKDSFYSGSATKRFQLLKSGLTNRIKQSTTNIEKVSGMSIKNGFVRILQSWKSTESPSTSTTSTTTTSNGAADSSKPQSPLVKQPPQQQGIEVIERRLSREDGSDSSKDSSLQSDTSVDSEDSFASVIYVPKKNSSPLIEAAAAAVLGPLQPSGPGYQLNTTSAPPSPRVKYAPDLVTAHHTRLKLMSMSPLLKQFPATSKSLPPPSPPGLSPRTLNQANMRPFFSGNEMAATPVGGNNSTATLLERIAEVKRSFDNQPLPKMPNLSSAEKLEEAESEPQKPVKAAPSVEPAKEAPSSKVPVPSPPKQLSEERPEPKRVSLQALRGYKSMSSALEPDDVILEDCGSPLITDAIDEALERLGEQSLSSGSDSTSTTTSSSAEDEDSRRNRLNQIKELLRQKPGFASRTKPAFPLVRRASTASTGRLETAVSKVLPRLLSLELFNPETDDLDSDSSGVSSPESVGSVISVISDERYVNSKKDNQSNSNNSSGDATDSSKELASCSTKPDDVSQKSSTDDSDSLIELSTGSSQSLKLLEAAANVASSLEDAVGTAVQQKTAPAKDATSSKPVALDKHISPVESTWNEECKRHLIDLTDRLSENLIHDIDQFCRRTKLADDEESSGLTSKRRSSLKQSQPRQASDYSDLDNNTKQQQQPQRSVSSDETVVDKQSIQRSCSEDSDAGSFVVVTNSGEFLTERELRQQQQQQQQQQRPKLGQQRYGNSMESSDIGDSIENTISSEASSQPESLTTRRFCTGSTASLASSSLAADHGPSRVKLCAQARSASEEIPARHQRHPALAHQQHQQTASRRSGTSVSNGTLSGSSSQESLPSDQITYHQYYHVFREGELDQLINKYVENLHIISSYYDHASWCIVAEKVQVWTI